MRGLYKGEHPDPEGMGPGIVTFHDDSGEEELLLPGTEFNWGYGGGGPADLAWALSVHNLAQDRTGTEAKAIADQVYQKVKWNLVSTWAKGKPWILTAFTLRAVIKAIWEEKHGSVL